jgi:hypothetical protein
VGPLVGDVGAAVGEVGAAVGGVGERVGGTGVGIAVGIQQLQICPLSPSRSSHPLEAIMPGRYEGME